TPTTGGPSATRASPRRPGTPPNSGSPPRRCACAAASAPPPRTPPCGRTARRRSTSSPSPAAAPPRRPSPSPPGCPSASNGAAAGAAPRCRCRPAPGATCSAAASTPAASPWPSCSVPLPSHSWSEMIFDVWAPNATAVEVMVAGGRRAMTPGPDGWWSLSVPEAGHGTRYGYVLDGDGPYPDPRSRWQPEGVFGPSAVYEHARYTWSDHEWKGRDLRGGVIYELHIGTFTQEGTVQAAADRLDHLVDLGDDFVEIMPVAPVPGTRNWGYDGVDLYAVNQTYGGPDGLKILVDACHRAGIGVILDVVYNHLGPSGNFLHPFGPYFGGFQGSYWGEAVNLDGPGSDVVRRYFIDNALQWLRDYHIDGLRLDAVHALHDKRAVHLLAELAEEVDALSCAVGRPLALIAESDLNDPRMVRPLDAGGLGMTAQWNDDVHHALHVAVTGETHGYYKDFAGLSPPVNALTRGVFHDGTYSSFRRRSHGRSSAGAPG